MSSSGSWIGVAVVATVLGLLGGPVARGAVSATDSLTLQAPTGLKVHSVYNPVLRNFVVWLVWQDAPDSLAAYVHPPDTTGWDLKTPPNQLSLPGARGPYTGDIDRTLQFRCTLGGTVGVDSVIVSYEVRREENLSGTIVLLPSYVPQTWLPVVFRDQNNNGARVDLGLQIRFSAGDVDQQGQFTLGVEDFEGFHIWRGLKKDGSDLEVIGEISKEQAAKGRKTGGSLADSLYFYDIIPKLRQSQPWFSPEGAVACLGTRIDLPLESNELFWYDCAADNGFTYYYAVTTFDRGYNVASGSQGLVKFDNCPVAGGTPYPCADQMVPLKVEVSPQNNLYNVYAVPNPYRTGGSRLTSANYHNFPDDKIRFVNVPAHCQIKVYTVAGDLVWEAQHDGPGGDIEWDVTNRNSQPVASGVYIYRVETPSGGQVYGRIAVIR